MQSRGLVPIWFFIGLLLLVYGIIIFSVSLYDYSTAKPANLVLANLHAGVWWGALLLVIGAVYTVAFYPRSKAGVGDPER